MKYILSLFILVSFSAFATDSSTIVDPKDSSLSDLVIPIYESLEIADYTKKKCAEINGFKRCKPELTTLKKGSKIRIISENKKGVYKIEVFSKDGFSKGIYHTSKKFADKALNWSAVNHTLSLLGSPNGIGAVPKINCNYGINLVSQMKKGPELPTLTIQENRKVYSVKEVADLMERYSLNADGSLAPRTSPRPEIRPSSISNAQTGAVPEEDLPAYNGEYLPGCEALKEDQIKEEHKDDLKDCVQSIRKAIAVGNARNSDGSLNRTNLYKNMFTKLNPKEQAFAGKFFTSIGEVEILDNKADYMSIMKVLKNRARFARQKEGDTKYNELDAALADWQFSMYNSAEPGWRKVLDPGKAISTKTLDSVLDAMVTLDSTDTSKYDNVYMYHANYVTPKDWDWNLLSEPFSMDFGSGLETKSSGGAYHKFYTPSNGLEGVYIGNFKKRRRDAN
ncbi:MAG: hypothetical protein ACJAT2_002500 [Bacteriovoracaceae bacterium]|jgi:hypothetical protein